MRVLLDECLPRKLTHELPGHEVLTASERGWAGKKNGELLRLASREFNLFITVDQGLAHQQDLRRLGLAVITLVAPSNRFDSLRPLMPKVVELLGSVRPGELVRVET